MKKFYAKNRTNWRRWLSKNHDKEKEVWLIFYKKASGKPGVGYNDAVEEALCFGWIDSIVHANNDESRVQRFSPRNLKSNWSELNRERARRLIAKKLMTPAGLKLLPADLDNVKYEIANEIAQALKKDKEVWQNFQKFDDLYKRIRIAYIWEAYKQKRFDEFNRRLKSFIKATKKNRKIGTIL
ncbi:MAG: hypothetical protein A2798_01135 [Candidatus Levybacteria bacterium RIFCSPHIGHO2_01_FULL_37_17]|nr:MAG: hypothetical protein A2798_01135 [Candidatus Levybacteria bacterium RIFCSPHIGHO2_01_FULL_37_17]OGH37056.1 MAG: hypothetical protein A2959_01995 [Candidatus Levybacteria bacterium RIFCSPLOWO2_01_FULL_38_23]